MPSTVAPSTAALRTRANRAKPEHPLAILLKYLRAESKTTRCTCHLFPASFPSSGRGLMATKPIAAKSSLIEVPSESLITKSSAIRCLLEWSPLVVEHKDQLNRLSQHQVLSLWLVVAKHTNDHDWADYIRYLPGGFESVAMNWPREILDLMPAELNELVHDIYRRVVADFNAVKRFLQLFVVDTALHDEFKWAWTCVNTRCISLIRNEPQTTQMDCNVQTTDTIALAPYFDLLNHHHDAVTIPLYDETTRRFVVVTETPFGKGEEAFINYGPHDDIFLAAEYGFVSSTRNSYNYVGIDQEIRNEAKLKSLKNKNIRDIIEQQPDLLNDHKITMDQVSHRTMNVLRLLQCQTWEEIGTWRKSVQGVVEQISTEHELRVMKVLKCILLKRREILEEQQQRLVSSSYSRVTAKDIEYTIFMAQKILSDSIEIIDSVLVEIEYG